MIPLESTLVPCMRYCREILHTGINTAAKLMMITIIFIRIAIMRSVQVFRIHAVIIGDIKHD